MIRLGIDARVVQDRPSGLVSYTKNLIKKLIEDDTFELYIFGQKKYQSVFSEFLERKNVHFVSVYFDPYFLSIKNFIYETARLHAIINAYNLDVFHNPFGYGVPLFLKAKTILTIHDIIPLYSYDSLTYLQKSVYKKSLAISLWKAASIVTISQFTKGDLLGNFPSLSEKPISVIYDGFDNLTKNEDVVRVFAELKSKYSLPDKYIVYLGSGTNRKNLVKMTEGFIKWKKKTSSEHKMVYISKFNRPETAVNLKKIQSLFAAEKWEDSMIHIQYVDNFEKAALLSHADLFIYPSIYEGFGLPLLEAASCGVPVCCSDLPIFHEVCQDGAYYFDPHDSGSIAQGITTCTSNLLERLAMTDAALKRIAYFSWDKMAAEYIKLYRSV